MDPQSRPDIHNVLFLAQKMRNKSTASLGPGSTGRVSAAPIPVHRQVILPAVQDPSRNRSLSILKPRMSTDDLGGATSSNSLSVSPMRRGRPEKHLRTASFNQPVDISGKQDVQSDRPASIAGSFWDDWNPTTQSQASVASSFSVSNQQSTTGFPPLPLHPSSRTIAGQNSSSFAGLQSVTSMHTSGQGGGSSASFMFEGLDPFLPSSLPRPMAPISSSMLHHSPAVTPIVHPFGSDFTPRQAPQVSVFQAAPDPSSYNSNLVTPAYGNQSVGREQPISFSQTPSSHPHNPFAHPRDNPNAFSPAPGPSPSPQILPLVPLPRTPSSSSAPHQQYSNLSKNVNGRPGQVKDPFGDPV